MVTKDKIKGKVLESALSLTIATIVVKVLGAIYKIPISYVLGEEGMGYFNSAYTVYSFFYLLCTAGVPKAIMILCAETDNYREHHENKIIKISLKFFICVGIVISLVFIAFSRTLARLIGSPDSYKSMIFIAPSILFASLSGVIRGYFSSRVKFIHVAISQIIEGAGKLVFGLILGIFSSRIFLSTSTVAAFSILGATCGSLLGYLYLEIKRKSEMSGDNKGQKSVLRENTTVIKRLIKISLPIAAGAMIMSIVNIIDLGIVMNRLKSLGFTTTATTALYGNYTTYATPIFNAVISLFTPITIAYMPVLIQEKNTKITFLNVIKDQLDISFFVFVPLTVGISVYSEEILLLLFEDGGVYQGSILLFYLILSVIFILPLSIMNCALEAAGEVKAPMISMLVGSIFKIISAYFLIGSPDFGIIGAPISTLIFYSVALITSLGIANKKIGVIPPIIRSIALPVINSFISIYSIYPIYTYLSMRISWMISFMASIISSIIIYVILSVLEGKLKRNQYIKIQNAQI